jgi:hypothetical protein
MRNSSLSLVRYLHCWQAGGFDPRSPAAPGHTVSQTQGSPSPTWPHAQFRLLAHPWWRHRSHWPQLLPYPRFCRPWSPERLWRTSASASTTAHIQPLLDSSFRVRRSLQKPLTSNKMTGCISSNRRHILGVIQCFTIVSKQYAASTHRTENCATQVARKRQATNNVLEAVCPRWHADELIPGYNALYTHYRPLQGPRLQQGFFSFEPCPYSLGTHPPSFTVVGGGGLPFWS